MPDRASMRLMPELMTVHDIMLAAGNAAFNEARAAAIRLAEQFECGAFPNMTPADALHMLAAALPRHSEIDAHKDRPDVG